MTATPDPKTEQDLEADGHEPPTSIHAHWQRRARIGVALGSERQGGNDRGDAERLSEGNYFEGQVQHRGDVPCATGLIAGDTGPKRDEPQDRQRDATSPQANERRKPSRWCETTRAERVSEREFRGRSERLSGREREWTLVRDVDGEATGTPFPVLRYRKVWADESRPLNRPGRWVNAPEWSEGEGVRIGRFFREPGGRTASGETPRMSPATGNIEGGAGKSNDLHRAPDGRYTTIAARQSPRHGPRAPRQPHGSCQAGKPGESIEPECSPDRRI